MLAGTAQARPGDAGYDPDYGQAGEYGVGTLDERVAKLEKRLSGEAVLEMSNRLDQLQADVQRLQGTVEELTHELETVKKQQKDLYTDLDQRLSGANPAQPPAQPDAGTEPPSAEPAPPPVAPPPPTPLVGMPPPRPPVADAAADSAARKSAYDKGFNLLKDSKYPEAVKEFKKFLGSYPSGEYADNAQYWMGEAYYVMRDFPSSREAFRKVIKDFPQSPKAADAQLKLGYIEYDTNQWANSRSLLNDVVKNYPGSNAAQLASKRLAKMKQEGR
jgi:tol-pal system protein YbgF